MIGLALLLASTQARMSLQYYQGTFFVGDGALIIPVATKVSRAPEDHVRFRRGDTYSVWDKRGLALRSGHWIYETRFQELAVSPKLFSKDEIKDTVAKVKSGNRALGATSLSGALRLGTDAFFLPRWIDKKGFTWLEVLVRVDLASKHPKPVLVGRFSGYTLASGAIDSRLIAMGAQPSAVVRRGGEWGVSTYDPLAAEFSFTHIGERLRAYAQLESGDVAFMEAEDGGLSRVGVADLMTASRNDALEDRGSIRILDSFEPACALVVTPDRTTIRNLETSAATDIPGEAVAQRTAFGILLWWPKVQPKHAVLLDPNRWDRIGSWQAPSGESEPPSPAPSPSAARSSGPRGRIKN
jgi:hypothetical protein